MNGETDDYAEEWEELTEKEILMGCLTELQQIRLLLQGTETDTDKAQTVYECKQCNETVTEDDKRTHAVNGHNAHSSQVDMMFSPVGE